jgi:hypothetical protein
MVVKMKKFLTIVSALILFTTQAFAIPVVGTVYQKMGTTWVERDSNNITIQNSGFELYMEDFLQTGEDGAMNIEFVDGTKFTLSPNSEAIIDQFAFDTSVIPIEIAMAVDINVGSFTYESGSISKMGGEVKISTPSATVTVQGTAFSGRVDVNGRTTITLLPDSTGNVGQVTVRNEAGASTITRAYTAVTVLSDNLRPSPPDPLSTNERKQLFELDTNEETIEKKVDDQRNRKKSIEKLEQIDDKKGKTIEQVEEVTEKLETQEIKEIELDTFDTQKESNDQTLVMKEDNFDVEITEQEAGNLEQNLMTEELTIVESTSTETVVIIEDFKVETEPLVNTNEVSEDIIVDDSVNTEVDTSFYDQWDDAAYDEEYGWVDENDQVTVWDAKGETKMNYEDSKKMYAEMDKAYMDAIGCENNCDWDSINWDDVDWDSVDWEALAQQQDATMSEYGLDTDWWNENDDLNVTDDVFTEIEKLEGDVTGDLDIWEDDPDIFDEGANQGDEQFLEDKNNYYSGDGPFLMTGKEDWCDPSWCTQQYIDEQNKYNQMDWDMNTKYTKWTNESKKLFNDLILNDQWYGDTTDSPKPWTISEIKDKYISEWGWSEWDIFWEAFYEWESQGSYDNWESDYEELSLDDQYSFEDDEIDEWEKEYISNLQSEPDCIYAGYYWDKTNQICGTEWVDNTGVTTLVTSSGEIINYDTGEITQTVTTVTNGVSSSVTQTGRYSTYNNTADYSAHSGSNGYKRMDRIHNNHRAYLTTNSVENFDIMIIQEQETQASTMGTAGSRAHITIIQKK